MARGLLVVCEGIDGSGKTTVSKGLAEALAARGHPARWTFEPSHGYIGEAVRRSFREDTPELSQAFLFMADHVAHIREVERLLEEGYIVVSDRWSDSTFAYQGAALQESFAKQGLDAMRWLMDVEKVFDRAPDLTLLFDLPPTEAMRRIQTTRKELVKFERAEFLEIVRANYLKLARERPHYRILDASRRVDESVMHALALVEGALRRESAAPS
ncbi:MAG TPA: dTMP kinase [Candidatus Thermoplasmatota archaeon]|nr:dTMP kinase [Candidatus Thermoplasmatota archaeon]